MRFLLDQNVSIKTADFLRNFNIEVLHINETELKGKSDTEIYEYCKSERLVLITFDHEFGFEYLSRKDLDGLIIIRIHPQTLENLHPILEKFFSKVKKGEINIKNNIVIIEKDKVRIRKVS